MVKTVTLAFCSIQYHFIKNIRVKFGIPKSPQSPDIGQTSDEVICNSRIFGQSLITKNCHNSRTRHDIKMKLGPVTNFNKRIMATSRKFDDDVISTNCIFSNLCPISAVRKPDSGAMLYKIYIFTNNNLFHYKLENKNKKSLWGSWPTTDLNKGTIFDKNDDFLHKTGDISKIKTKMVLKSIFSATKYVWVVT